MSKYKLTTLSPIHISSGEEFELNYNLLEKDGFVYLYDEFRLVEFFIAHDIVVSSSLESLKKLIESQKDKIIASGLHIRKVKSDFHNLSKPLLENIATAENPIITGSSLKGSFRTAILDCMTNRPDNTQVFIEQCKDKRFDEDRFKKRFDNDLASLFKYLKVTDSLVHLETKVYKIINVKKEKSHQGNRDRKVEEIGNYVEAIEPNQVFEIEITDSSENEMFKSLGKLCNEFYIPFFGDDEKHYASKNGYLKNKVTKLSSTLFLINVGRFSGAERKSLNNLRYIKASKADDKSETSARTFSLEKSSDNEVYFEDKLLPFGWILCEAITEDKDLKESIKLIKEKSEKTKIEKFKAIDKLHMIQVKKEEEEKALAFMKEKAKEEEQKKEAEAKAEQEAKLAAMTPLQRLIDSYDDIAKLINDMKAGQVEDFESIKLELAKEVKKELQKNEKTWNKAKKKALDRKNYIEGLLK